MEIESKIFNSRCFDENGEYSKLKAYLYLVNNATEVGEEIKVVIRVSQLCSIFKWSKSKVYRFIDDLKNQEICKYDDSQKALIFLNLKRNNDLNP